MPTLPKNKRRPWIPTKKRDSKGLTPRSAEEHVKFYNSKQWRSLRNYFIQMNPLCNECDKRGYITPGECVDHIKPIRFGGQLANINNLQTLCNSCHARKSGRESRITKNNYNDEQF